MEEVVLVVDDDPSIQAAMQLALGLGNRTTVLASDGAEALAWLRTNPPPRLILLDLMMPVMDGWQLLEHLRNDDVLATVPVVVITAFGRDLGSAANRPVIRKPFELDELLEVVGRNVRA